MLARQLVLGKRSGPSSVAKGCRLHPSYIETNHLAALTHMGVSVSSFVRRRAPLRLVPLRRGSWPRDRRSRRPHVAGLGRELGRLRFVVGVDRSRRRRRSPGCGHGRGWGRPPGYQPRQPLEVRPSAGGRNCLAATPIRRNRQKRSPSWENGARGTDAPIPPRRPALIRPRGRNRRPASPPAGRLPFNAPADPLGRDPNVGPNLSAKPERRTENCASRGRVVRTRAGSVMATWRIHLAGQKDVAQNGAAGGAIDPAMNVRRSLDEEPRPPNTCSGSA
jgi:hypothetical protein